MQVLFVEEHFGLGTGRFLWSHNDAGFLANVVVQQLAVGRHGQLALHPLVIVGTRPVCGELEIKGNCFSVRQTDAIASIHSQFKWENIQCRNDN